MRNFNVFTLVVRQCAVLSVQISLYTTATIWSDTMSTCNFTHVILLTLAAVIQNVSWFPLFHGVLKL